MTLKQYFFNVLLLLFIQTISAQKASIKGMILDNQNEEPIEYASIALLSSFDNSFCASLISARPTCFSSNVYCLYVPYNIVNIRDKASTSDVMLIGFNLRIT